MASSSFTSLHLEAMAITTHTHPETQRTRRSQEGSDQSWQQLQRPVAYVTKPSSLDGDECCMVSSLRIIQSAQGMERACFQETNRPRTPVRLTTRPDPYAKWCGRGPQQCGPYADCDCSSVSELGASCSKVVDRILHSRNGPRG